MAQDSNIDEVVRWLESFYRGFSFLRPGKDQSLGRDLANVIAGGIQLRAATELRGADPRRWDPNREPYRTEKEKKYGWSDMPNFRTGQMLSLTSLKGRTVLTETTGELHYGEDRSPDTSYSPTGYLSNQDKQVTDRKKAEYCSANRPFFEWDDRIEEDVINEAAEQLMTYILTEG